MIKKILFCFLAFFVSVSVWAQDPSNVVVWQGEKNVFDYRDGQMVVLGDIGEKPKKFDPIQAVWNPETPKIFIKTPFQEKVAVPQVLYIPYFFINVQLLSDCSAIISEYIQLILPPDTEFTPFSRTYLTEVQDEWGRKHTFNPTFLEFRKNGTPLAISQQKEDGKIIIKPAREDAFYPMVYTYEIKYMLPNAVQQMTNGDYNLFLSLLGNDIPYLMENLVIRLDFPRFTPIAKADVSFGKENIKNLTAAYFVRESDETLVLRSKGVYPTGLDVRVNIEMKEGTFEKKTAGQKLYDFLFGDITFFVAILGAIFIVLYYVLAAYLSWKEIKRPRFKKKVRFHPAVMRLLLLRKMDFKALFGMIIDLTERKKVAVEKIENEYVLILQKTKQRQLHEEKVVLKRLMGKKSKAKLSELFAKDIVTFLQQTIRSAEQRVLRPFYMLPFLTGIVLISVCEYVLIREAEASLQTELWVLVWLLVVFAFSWRYFKKHNAYPSYLKNAYENEWKYLSDLPNKSGKNLGFYASMDMPLDDLMIKSSSLANSGINISNFEKEFLDFFVFNGRKK